MPFVAAIVTLDTDGVLTPSARAALEALAGMGVRITYAEPSRSAVISAFAALDEDARSTWVLTSSEEVLEAARGVGLHTCAVLAEGEAEAKGNLAFADIVAHGWAEVNHALLDDFACNGEGIVPGNFCRVLIVSGSPEPSSPALVARLAHDADYVVACDAGAKVCRSAGVVPQVFVGDGDSADGITLAWIHAVVERFIVFPPEKYATDLALAIEAARHEAARRRARLSLTLTCASGGRPDHSLAVLGILAGTADTAPRIVEDGFELRILSPEGVPVWQLGEVALNRMLSVVALAPGTSVTERGLRWELDRRELPLLGDEGISNLVTGPDACVECHCGALAVFLIG